MEKPSETSMQLQTGTLRPEDAAGRKVHGVVEVKTYLIDVDLGAGRRETIMVRMCGDEAIVVENKGRQLSGWLKEAIQKRIAGSKVEQG